MSGSASRRAPGAARCRVRVHLVVLALYCLLAVGLTWPLVRHLSTHVPGSATWAFDEYTFLWNSWWFRYSLFNLGQDPLVSTHTFYPVGTSLALYTYNLFNSAISVPLQASLTLPAISNLTFLATTALSGYGTFLLLVALLRPGRTVRGRAWSARLRLPAAFLAGLIYAFGSCRMVYASLGHHDLWSTAWIPFHALYLVKTIREPHIRNAALAALFLALTMLCEMSLGVFVVLLSAVLLAFALGRWERARVAGGVRRLIGRLAVLAAVVLLLCLPVLVPVLREMLSGYALEGWGDAGKLSVDLAGYVTPAALHPLGGDWETALRQVREGTSRFQDVNTVFLGWAGLALAALGAVVYRRRLAAWAVSAALFAVLGLGPLLQVNGRSAFNLDGLQVNVPLPFILLHYVPVVQANRVPNRFSVVLMLALAVLGGFGIAWLLGRIPARRTPGSGALRPLGGLLVSGTCLLLASALLFEHWSVPLPLTDARIPAVYAEIAEDEGDYAVLQLPLGWRNSFGVQGAESTQTQYYQSAHHKRLLSGNTSRNPPFLFDYFRQVPILDSLVTLQTYGQVPADARTADRATAADFLAFYDIRAVVVAPGTPGRPPYVDTRDSAVAYLEEVLPLEKVTAQDGWLLYRVDRAPLSPTLTVDSGSGLPLERMATGTGWGQPEVIQGRSARWMVEQGAALYLPAAPGSEYRLTVHALPFEYAGAAAQQLAVRVNGRPQAGQVMAPGWSAYSWDVPADLLRSGLNDLHLQVSRLDAPADVLPEDGQIGRTGVQAPVAIEVNSGGPGALAYISIGEPGPGQLDGSLHSPGYNLAVLDPRTGRLLEQRAFDTTPSGDPAEAAALADFLDGIPPGRIVAVAVQGDGGHYLTAQAMAALLTIGGQADPREREGASHALLGVKGSPAGSALEATGAEGAWLRAAPDRRTLGIAVDGVTWERIVP